jgi:hypothetical protein
MTSKSKSRGRPTKKSKRNISGLKNQPSSAASERASSSSSAAASQPQSHPPLPPDLPSDSLEQFNDTTRVDWEKEDLSINSEADSEDEDLPDTFEDQYLNECPEVVIWRFINQSWQFMSAYRQGLTRRAAEWAVQKQKQHCSNSQ